MTAPILELRNLCKHYGLLRSVDDISVSLAQGEFMSFLGPSGSGKTTTLNMIAGLIEPTSGEMFLQSRSIVKLPPYKRNIGVVFQNYALFPHMTVAQNIAFPLEMRRVPKAEVRSRVGKALDLVKLSGMEDRLPVQLSGGQQQRVALARAMVFEPPVLLMDEPLGALDKQLREQMQIEIKHLHERLGITVVYVTHDQDEALTMSDRIAVFNHGKIEQLGLPAELYNQPATLFVAGFVGETNLIAGQVTDVAAGTCRIESAGFSFQAEADGVTVGQAVTVALRPERIRISGDPSDASALPGRVVETIYYGRSRKNVVAVGELTLNVVEQLQGLDDRQYAQGEPVSLLWDRRNATVLCND